MHSRNPGYQPGNHWLVCDVCGFDYRFSDMKRRWDGAWVCKKDFEERHPQDFVRGRRDHIRVPVARPTSTIGIRSTTLSISASKGAKTISVTSADNISANDSIGIVFETFSEEWDTEAEVVQWTQVESLVGTTLTLFDRLWSDVASGNKVYLSQVTGPNFISPTATTVDDL